jgi:hypothetical protein
MNTIQWVLLFAALFIVLIVLALIARSRRTPEPGSGNPYATGEDPSPRDAEFGRDSDMDLERRREADFDDGGNDVR